MNEESSGLQFDYCHSDAAFSKKSWNGEGELSTGKSKLAIDDPNILINPFQAIVGDFHLVKILSLATRWSTEMRWFLAPANIWGMSKFQQP